MRKILIAIITLLASSQVLAAPQVGDQAPDFTLQGSDGKTYTLSEFKGKRHVVIAFFPKAFTSGWTIECKALRDSDQQIHNYNVAYFMASTDNIQDNTGFAEKNDASFPILADPGKSMCDNYGVLAKQGYARRWTYYIDDEGIILMIDKQVDPRTAGAQLVENLEALKVPKSS